MNTISIIVPCYNEEEAIPVYYEEMQKIMEMMKENRMELIFVDDGSTDGTLETIRSLSRRDERCRYYSFSRNFGKEAAMYAGLSHATGDYVAIMDVDLQDPPELLMKMYQLLQQEDCDCVATRRANREGEPKLRSFLSDSFYKVINKMSKTGIVNGARDYRMMKRRMVDAVLAMSEYNRFSKGIFQWVGFRTVWLEFENTKRCAGETKWSMGKLFSYSLEGITGFSVAPLSLASVVGVTFCFISFLMILFIVGRTWIFGDPVAGWPSLVCIIFLVSGIQLFCTGIVGEYLSKTYLETKHRPIYILKEESAQAGSGQDETDAYGEMDHEENTER
ncbi:MAG: glycosyltransferase [Clostridia bacterium]|nr:glycosyltransferase [Clostridia bacterium]NCC43644.1 glycosyltransferase [Clostridia bacterium]